MYKSLLVISLMSTTVFLSACGTTNTTTTQPSTPTDEQATTVSDGTAVEVNYVGTLSDGTIFDTNIEEKAKEAGTYNELISYDPLPFTVGEGKMIPGFEQGVIGMKKGETKTIEVPVAQGYGEVREDLVRAFPASELSGAQIDLDMLEIGKTYNFDGMRGTITEKSDAAITIDFNHPLAGKDLTFEVTVVDIK